LDISISPAPISGLAPDGAGIAGKMVHMQLNEPLKPHAEPRSAYRVLRTIPTRWSDNDVYGHVNNVVYYGWFDTAVNAYLMEQGVLDIHAGDTIGLVVETQCNYFVSVSFPEVVQAGIRIAKLGTSSVRYEIGIFGEGETTAAKGHFIHVYVDRLTRKPVPLPDALRQLLETLQ
jgi:acyl-CoA thioester hydrolase